MPRYHFNLKSRSPVKDHKGRVLPDIASARMHACRLAFKLIARTADRERDLSSISVVVTEDGAEVFNLPVLEAAAAIAEAQEPAEAAAPA